MTALIVSWGGLGSCRLLASANARAELSREIQVLVRGEARHFSVSAYDPLSGFRLAMDEGRVYPAASVMKLPLLMALYRHAQLGRVRLAERVRVSNSFRSVVDGSPYRVPDERMPDCRCVAFRNLRRPMSLAALSEDMIRSSSNLATNLLILRLGLKQIRLHLKGLGINGVSIVRGLYDMKAYDRNIHNTMTARSAADSMLLLAGKAAFRVDLRRRMLTVLGATEHRSKIPAHLPASAFVVQKSGYTQSVSHDVALIYPPDGKPFVLALFSGGHVDAARLEERMAAVARLIYDAVLAERRRAAQ